jgi:hypothetical protein
MAYRSELAMNAVSTSTRFIAEIELSVLRESLRYFICGVGNHTQKAYRAAPAVFRNVDGYGLLVDVQANE